MSKLIERAGAEVARLNICKYVGRDEGCFAPNYDRPIFDPANVETDDYYCLVFIKRMDQFEKFCTILRQIWIDRLAGYPVLEGYTFTFGMYETGDYMNAYLEVMEDEQTI